MSESMLNYSSAIFLTAIAVNAGICILAARRSLPVNKIGIIATLCAISCMFAWGVLGYLFSFVVAVLALIIAIAAKPR